MNQTILQGGSDAVRSLNRFTLRLLGLVGRVRPDERRDTVAALLVLVGFMAGHALLETARDALFLAALPARQLPWIYLAIALTALSVGRGEPALAGRLAGGNVMRWWLLIAGLVTTAFWVLADTGWRPVYHGLYIWSGVLASMVVVRFWTVLGSRFTLTQAKRIFPVIASGSVAGAILGSALARSLTPFMAPRHLVLSAGLVFLATAAAPMVGGAAPGATPRPVRVEGLGRIARVIWSGPYLRRVALMVLLAAVTFTLVDYTFKSAADRLVPAQDLGEFFASVYLTINLLSLLVQVAVVAWLLRRMGLVSVAAVVPAVLLVATVGFVVSGGLALALVLKGADGTLRHSLYRTGTEILFVPLSHRLRVRVKGLIDVMGQRGGQALASIVILMVLSTTGNESVFAGLACLTSAAWLVVAAGLKEPYLDLFRKSLYGDGKPSALPDPALDQASLETLVATLAGQDDRRVLAALELLADQERVDAVPGLLLYHPSPAVVIRALDAFSLAGREDVAPMVARLVEGGPAEVRIAAVRALAVLGPDRGILEAAAADGDPAVSLTAWAMLLACGWADAETADKLHEAAREAGSEERTALAAAMRFRPHPAFEPALRVLLDSEEPGALVDAVRTAHALRSPGLLLPLVRCLGRRVARDEARRALAAYGALGVAPLSEALRDRSLPSSIRRHVPGALALTGSPQIPTVLLQHLHDETDGMIRFKVLRALGRWRREQPGLPLDMGLLQNALAHALSTGYRLMGWRHRLEKAGDSAPALRTEVHEVLVALLRDKQDHALERIFRLLNLQAGSEEFHRVYRGVHSPQPAVRAGSRELLHHMILPPVRKALMTLVDDLHGEIHTADLLPQATRGIHRDYGRVLSELVGCGMESASSLAAVQAADVGLVMVLEAIEAARPLSEEHARTLERAARQLGKEAA